MSKMNAKIYPFLKILLLAITFSLYMNAIFSQTTTLKGLVVDKHTEEPLPFCSVFLKNSTIGISTDINGQYTLQIQKSEKYDSLSVSAIGYTTRSKVINGSTLQIINFKLDRTSYDLAEVIILPGENPADVLMKKVIAAKKNNSNSKFNNYQYEIYNKIELDLDEIDKRFMHTKFMKPFAFVLENIDSVSEEKPFLPIFLTETISQYYFSKNPSLKKEIIQATKVSGIKNQSVNQFLGNMYLDYDIYDNWIALMTKEFISPLANSGLLYYKYYLVDSAMIKGQWCYKLTFMPKGKGENSFVGDFWIHSKTKALVLISMQIADHVNLNFVERLSIYKEYDYIEKEWLLKKDKIIVDFISPGKNPGIIGRKTTSYKDIQVNLNETEFPFKEKSNIIIEKGAQEKDFSYWQKARHDSLSNNEVAIYNMVDSIKKTKAYKTYADLAFFLFTGYKLWGNFEIGPYSNLFGYNDVQKQRFSLGIRTSNDFSKRLMISSYAAYGLGNKQFKFGFSSLYLFNKQPRSSIELFYKNDYNIGAQNIENFDIARPFSGIFRRNIPWRLLEIEAYNIGYFKEFSTGFSAQINLKKYHAKPITHSTFSYNFPAEQVNFSNTVTSSEIDVKLRFAYQEKFVSGEFERISLGSQYPIVSFQYTAGLKGVLESDFQYHKVVLTLSDKLILNPIGKLKYQITAGKIFNTLPYILLRTHFANETYYYVKDAFNNMRRYEFVSDEYIKVSIEHLFDGFILDHVPLIKKLKWRSLLTLKSVMGRLSLNNLAANSLNNIQAPSRVPYTEMGIGIENIFKFFRIDAIWRVSYLSAANASKFGIRGSVEIKF